MAVRRGRSSAGRPPVDAAGLERLALRYVERYATTRARLARYLARKLGERGWDGDEEPQVEAVVRRMAALGYVDDAAFATARATTLARRGLGERRVAADLRAAGIADDDATEARATARDQALAAALRYAERRRIGPYAENAADRAGRDRALAAMLRAGHPFALARRIVDSPPGEEVVPLDT